MVDHSFPIRRLPSFICKLSPQWSQLAPGKADNVRKQRRAALKMARPLQSKAALESKTQ